VGCEAYYQMIDIIWKAAVAFLVVGALDVVWVGYTASVNNKRPFAGGVYAMLIYAGGGTIVIGYTTENWLLIPAILGAFGGTYAAIWWRK